MRAATSRIRSRLVRAGLVLAATALIPVPTSAQEEAQIGATSLLASAPKPGSSAAAITIGFEINDGRTETRGYSIDATWARMTMSHTLVRLDGQLKRADFRPAVGADRITVDDTKELTASLVHPLKGKIALLGEASFKRDAPVELDHRALLQAGIGFNIIRGETFLLSFGPMVGVGRQNNAAAPDAAGITIIGGIQSLSWRVSPTFGIETSLHGYSNLDDSDDHVIDLSVAGTSRIASRLGLKVSYSWTKEGIHPANVSDIQRRLQVGATITLAGG